MGSKKKKDPKPGATVMVCYRGNVSGHENAGIVPHTAALVATLAEPGTVPLMVRPGLCPVPASQWERYKDHKPIADRVESGELEGPKATEERASSRDKAAIVDLINMTQDIGGLEWLLDMEEARQLPRQQILAAIHKRAPKCRESLPLDKMPVPIRRAPAAASAKSASAPA